MFFSWLWGRLAVRVEGEAAIKGYELAFGAPFATADGQGAEQAPELLAYQLGRNQHHDFMNELQVVLGWLALGEGQRALACIENMAQAARAEGEVLQRLPDGLVPWLWTWTTFARHQGVKVSLLVAPDDGASAGAGVEVLALPALRYCLGELLPLPSADVVPAVTLHFSANGLKLVYSNLGRGQSALFKRLYEHPALAAWRRQQALSVRRDGQTVKVNLPTAGGRMPG